VDLMHNILRGKNKRLYGEINKHSNGYKVEYQVYVARLNVDCDMDQAKFEMEADNYEEVGNVFFASVNEAAYYLNQELK
jgi:hypothetical protein